MGRQKKRDEDNFWDEAGEVIGSEDNQATSSVNNTATKESEKPKPSNNLPNEDNEPETNGATNETDEAKKKKKKKKKPTAPAETKKEAAPTTTTTTEPKVATKKTALAKKILEQQQKMKEQEEKERLAEEARLKQEQEEEEKRKQEQEHQEKLRQERNQKKKQKMKEKAKNQQVAEQQRKLALLLGQGVTLPVVDSNKTSKKPDRKKKVPKEDEKVSESSEIVSQPVAQEENKVSSEDTLESWEDLDNDALVQPPSKQQTVEKDQAPAKPVQAKKEPEQKAKASESKPTESTENQIDLNSQEPQDKGQLRSPICVVLGHVDTGKTKLLDKIRRTNVQEGEAGGITQQIGATFFPMDALKDLTSRIKEASHLQVKVPGLLIIDTPGHESFTNLRSRGSGLCDIAILVVDITADKLEKQTIESINLLKMRKTPFIVALNKIDRMYGWKPHTNSPIQDTLKKQDKHAVAEFEQKVQDVTTFLAEQGLNAALYYKNKDFRKYISIVPTSAITGEGVADLLMLLVQLTQRLMSERLLYLAALQCTVLEVKVIEGFGTTVDVILVNGVLHEGDTIVLCGMNGPIVTTIRALLTPQPMKELRVKGQYQHHKVIHASQGIKISAADLDKAIPGSSLLVAGPNDNLEQLKTEVMKDFEDMKKRISTTDRGVYVQASTLGSLEALMEFLKESKIPVANINIGPVSKKDVVKASIMLEHAREYAVILAFDVKVPKDVQEHADELGVKIFTANIIYHLFDKFTLYMENIQNKKKEESAPEAVFPVRMRIYPEYIFNKKDPIVLGVEIVEGSARIGTPIVVPSKDFCYLGRITSIENNHKPVQTAKRGASVAIKLEQEDPSAQQKVYGRHFEHTDELVSRISRVSIDLLKEHFRNEIEQEDVNLIQRLKPLFGIPTGPKKGAKSAAANNPDNNAV